MRDEGPRTPTFIIAGAMRSGTTSLARWLGAHPDVHMAAVKEVHYFDRNYDKGPAWYAAHFSEAGTRTAIGEATPNYLYHRLALERIAQDLPEVALLIILRDPVTRAYSHYHHRRERGGEVLTFDEAIKKEPERLRSPEEQVRAHYSYVDRGRYLGQLQTVYSLFPRHAVHVLLFEDLRDDPAGTFQEAARFLRLERHALPESVGVQANRYQRFRSRRLRRVTQHMPPSAARLVGRLNRVDTEGYPPMSSEARDRLVEIFGPERRDLSSLIGRDLGCWQS